MVFRGSREGCNSCIFRTSLCSGFNSFIHYDVHKGITHGEHEELPIPKRVKLTLQDFIWTAENVEPRVLAVLPAAIIHFPKSFTKLERLPRVIKQIVDAIKNGEKKGPDLNWVSFEEMKRWADASLRDGRTKPLKSQKIRKTYRFSPEVVRILQKNAAQWKGGETSLIENLILKAFNH